MGWPPKVGESLPRAAEAWGVAEKLSGYSLNVEHASGGPKARGFERILGITGSDLTYLETAVRMAVLAAPISDIRIRPPYGVHCEVRISVRGLGPKQDRVAEVVTAWELSDERAAPRLVNAYITG